MHALLISVAVVYGAVAGVFLARPCYRLSVEPEHPWRAACPAGHSLAGPFAGWLGRARCRDCATTERAYGRSAVRFAVPCAVCCGALAAVVGERPELAVWLLAAPVAVLLAAVDRAVHRLPDVLTLPLTAGVVVGLGVVAALPEAIALPGAVGDWPRALLGGTVLGAVYFLLFLIRPEGWGLGDVKLAVPVGVALGWYGWDVVFLGTFAGSLLAAGYGWGLVVMGRAGRKTPMPLGPFIASGALVGLLLGGLAA